MTKHIGIVACSAEGAALCYRTICAEGPAFMGEHCHPEITMHTHPLSEYMRRIHADNWHAVAGLMLSSANILRRAGADFAICPDNTIHQAFDKVIKKSPLPWLHIAEVVAQNAKDKGFGKLGILGTKYLMTGPVYPKVLEKLGIKWEIPNGKDREQINNIIFGELVNAVFTEKSRLFFNDVIEKLKNTGCDAIVLGCTEIPLIIDPQACPLPILDSTRLLAREALHKALSED
jgi:aspartate racemase